MTANFGNVSGTDIQCYIAFDFATVCTCNTGCRCRDSIIYQSRITADIYIRTVFAVTAGAVAHHAGRSQNITALHLNVARDLQVGVTLNGALIRAADHIVQTAGRGWIDRTACRNHHISAVHCGFVAAAVERFA